MWLGYYENAFRLLRECYAELDRPRTDPDCADRTWHDAFRPASTSGSARSATASGGTGWHTSRERRAARRARAGGRALTRGELLRALRFLGDFCASLFAGLRVRFRAREAEDPPLVLSMNPTPPRRSAEQERSARPGVAAHPDAVLAAVLEAVGTLSAVLAGGPRRRGVARSAELGRRVGRRACAPTLADCVRRDDPTRRSWHFVALVRATVRGMLVDGSSTRPRAPRRSTTRTSATGSTPRARAGTSTSPLVRGLYDLVFAYETATPTGRGSPRAGLLLSAKMFFDYRGAIFWKMTAGMGDVVFAPLYQALRRAA